MDMELEGSLNSLYMDLGKSLRAPERERNNVSDKVKSIVREIDRSKGMAIKARERYCNTRYDTIGGIIS